MINLIEQFSRERLKLMTGDDIYPVATIGEVQALARIALSVIDANHIGTVYIDPEDGEPTVGWIEEPWDMPPGTKLYTLSK